MMKFGMLIATFMTMTFAVNAHAQSMWGTGVYGGMQSCPYNIQLGDGASSALDDIKQAQKDINEAQRELNKKKTEKKKADRDLERAEKDVRAVIADDYSDFIFEHIQNGRQCGEYKGVGVEAAPSTDTGGPAATIDEGSDVRDFQNQSRMPAADAVSPTPITPMPMGPLVTPTLDTRPFGPGQWGAVCDPNRSGGVFPAVCDYSQFRQQDGDSRGDVRNCKKGLSDYRKYYSQSQKLQREIDSLERSIARAKDDMKDAKQAMIDDMRSNTEGGICVQCMANASGYAYQSQNNSPNWAGVVGNVAAGLLGIYAGYQTNKMVAQYNSNLGFPTQPYPAVGYGLPYIAAGIYGALGGGTGQGGFGCGGLGGGMGGAFGYPGGMYGPMMGGGMYMPGMMMGMMSGGMMAGGMPMGMMMNGGMMTGMMAGGMMMNGGMMTGMMAGGMMAGGMPMGMMMNGGLMTGMMAAGMPMGMMMNGGLMTGMMMNGGLMTGMMSTGMMMNSSIMQMQQQMLQMQMQQYQAYMQQQAQKQQVMGGLQSELYSLLYRIQQVQYGGLGTTGLGTTGYLGANTGMYGGSITGGTLSTMPTTTVPYTTIPVGSATATTPLGTGR